MLSLFASYTLLLVVIECFRVVKVILPAVRTLVAAANLVRRSQVLHQVLFAFVDAITHRTDELKQKQTAGVSTIHTCTCTWRNVV